MSWIIFLKWAHVIGACVLIGTGAGIAFFMAMAQRSRDARLIAHVAETVVVADFVFTASAVVVQPITGLLLARAIGWPLTEPWLLWSIGLYVLIGVFWLPVVWIQMRLRDLAREAAAANAPLARRLSPPLPHLVRLRRSGLPRDPCDRLADARKAGALISRRRPRDRSFRSSRHSLRDRAPNRRARHNPDRPAR